MKRSRFFLFVFIICTSLLVGCAKKDLYSVYQYPVLPGTKEWEKVRGNHEAMINACKLPEEWLKADTASLLGCVLTYPLLSDAFMSSSFRENPADYLANDFNGMKELLSRDDLIQTAKSFEIEKLEFYSENQKKLASRMLTYLQSYPELPELSK